MLASIVQLILSATVLASVAVLITAHASAGHIDSPASVFMSALFAGLAAWFFALSWRETKAEIARRKEKY